MRENTLYLLVMKSVISDGLLTGKYRFDGFAPQLAQDELLRAQTFNPHEPTQMRTKHYAAQQLAGADPASAHDSVDN